MFDTSMQLLDADIPKDLNEAKEKLKEGLIDYVRFALPITKRLVVTVIPCVVFYIQLFIQLFNL